MQCGFQAAIEAGGAEATAVPALRRTRVSTAAAPGLGLHVYIVLRYGRAAPAAAGQADARNDCRRRKEQLPIRRGRKKPRWQRRTRRGFRKTRRLHHHLGGPAHRAAGHGHRRAERVRGPGAAAPHRPVYQSVLLWALEDLAGFAGRAPSWGVGSASAGGGGAHHRVDGALRFGAHSRAWHSGGHRSHSDQRQ